jgi:hypothetical protein
LEDGKPKYQPGTKKIDFAVRQTLVHEFEYLWVDTICIDKSNSTELFEAINSMFRWYAEAKVCYAYLEDIRYTRDIPMSRWFTRGWTLQELLAPVEVAFFNADWRLLGWRRRDTKLRDLLLEATGISKEHERVLESFQLDDWTVAQRMSWAAKRNTTRREDVAYSLLGIFGVHIPLLYGEGDRAFIRLQEEIMRVSDDHSLFAWTDEDVVSEFPCGLLARSPAQFANATKFDNVQWRLTETMDDQMYEPFRMTNQGVHIQLTLIPLLPRYDDDDDTFYALLGYGQTLNRPAIIVRRLIRNEFARIRAHSIVSNSEMVTLNGKGRHQTLVVRQRHPVLRTINPGRVPMYWVDTSQLAYAGITLKSVQPTEAWDPSKTIVHPRPNERCTLTFEGHSPFVGRVHFDLLLSADSFCYLERRDTPEDRRQWMNESRVVSWNAQFRTAFMKDRIKFAGSRGLEIPELSIIVDSIMELAEKSLEDSDSDEADRFGRFVTVLLRAHPSRRPFVGNKFLNIISPLLLAYACAGFIVTSLAGALVVKDSFGVLRGGLSALLERTAPLSFHISGLAAFFLWLFIKRRYNPFTYLATIRYVVRRSPLAAKRIWRNG